MGLIHIGDRLTLKTACGKPVKRRWWMERKIEAIMSWGNKTFVARRTIHVSPQDISCKACRRTL